MFLKKKYKKNFARIYNNPENGDKFALIAINGLMKEKVLEQFNKTYSIEGSHIKNGGKSSAAPILTLLSGTGALGVTAATSGTLFMATANPATLMAIGNGVGSAVMGATGVVAQAPFIPVSAALMPVAAPLIAFQAITTLIILDQFKTINKKLESVEKGVQRILQRMEAIYIGEVISADQRLEFLEKEYYISKNFSSDMIVRLALIEDKVNPIFERYKYLYESQNIDKRIKKEDIDYKLSDAYMAIMLSILDLRIEILRIKLTVQENPIYMKQAAEILINKVGRYQELWTNISKTPERVAEVSQSLSDIVRKMNLWEKNIPGWLWGKRQERKELQERIISLDDTGMRELMENTEVANQIGQNLLKSYEPTLLYWEDQFGKHSYYTNDILIESVT